MPMLADDREMDTALQLAAQHPFEGTDPGMIARMQADFGAMLEFSNTNANRNNMLDAMRDFRTKFYEESGQRLPEPGYHITPGKFLNPESYLDQSKRIFDQWKVDHPESDLAFPGLDDLQKQADDRAREARGNAKALERRSTGTGSAVGGFIGSAGGAMVDPINVISMGAGASAASGILRTALTEGAIAATSESAIQAARFEDKTRIDPTFTAGDAFNEILAAGVGGAVLGGGLKGLPIGLKGLAAVWQRAKNGYWPTHVRDTANVVTREAAIPPSRFEKSMAGDTAHQGALFKATEDLSRGRPVELPPEAFVEAGARPGRVYDADGNSVGVRYEVVEADDLVTSHMSDLALNPEFPQELQPRDRTRAMSQDQIAGIASNLQPERLGFSSDAANGAPIVGPDGLVESGNGRVLALRRAFEQDGPQANSYRNYLRAQNFDVEGFRNPVLIARRITDLDDRVGFVTAANRSTSMRLGATEQALSDARLLDGDLLDRWTGADIGSADNQAFARGFMAKLPRAEQGNLIDKDGFLSQEGQRRITSALMGRAYGEPVLLGRALEDTDSNIKGIAGALADSSGSWARMRDAVSRGEIPAGMDITDDLMNSVRLVMKARDEGRAVKDMVEQAEMFGGPDELSKIVARAMFSDADMKRPIGRAKLAAFLNDFATEAMKNDNGPRLFGDALDAPDILKSSLERVGRQDLQRIAEERLTPEAVEKLRNDPQTVEASIMDGERLIADSEPGRVMIDLGDGLGERDLDDIMREADEEIAAGKEIEACTIGKVSEE